MKKESYLNAVINIRQSALSPTQSKALNATETTILRFSFGLILLPFMPQGWF